MDKKLSIFKKIYYLIFGKRTTLYFFCTEKFLSKGDIWSDDFSSFWIRDVKMLGYGHYEFKTIKIK